MKQKIILPGEEIATEEEYSAGRNTFAQEGKIKSKITGTIEFDEIKKEAKVKGKSIQKVRMGDIVIGKTMMVKESSAVIELLSAENGKRITGIKTAQLPIRNISTEYVSELKQIMKIGDIIRAKITQSTPLGIDLATNETGLGVIKAYCSNCRKEMQYNNEKMMCLTCGNVEDRKWFEKEQKAREFAPREGGFRPREGGFRGRGNFSGGSRGREGGFGGRREGGFRGRENPSERPSFGERPRSFGGNRRFNEEGAGSGERRSFGERKRF